MSLKKEIYKDLRNKCLTREIYCILIVLYYIFHTAIMLLLTLFNDLKDVSQVGTLTYELSGYLYIPVQLLFLFLFCSILVLRINSINNNTFKYLGYLLVPLTAFPILTFCLYYAMVPSDLGWLPVAKSYKFYMGGLNRFVGVNWIFIDIGIVLALLIPKDKQIN